MIERERANLSDRPDSGDPIDDVTIIKRADLAVLLTIAEAARDMRDYYEMDSVDRSEQGIPEQALLKALDAAT
jgi:hypothetical protein